MSLTGISSLESTRRKFFMNSTYIMSRKRNETFLCSGGRNESNNHLFDRIGRRKFFMNPAQNMCKNLESNVFGLRRPK